MRLSQDLQRGRRRGRSPRSRHGVEDAGLTSRKHAKNTLVSRINNVLLGGNVANEPTTLDNA
jgi:hypothetical protein